MRGPSPMILMVCGYSFALLVAAWATDALGMRSAKNSAAWRTGNFLYHDTNDAWKCHEDQWLWPASFDPEKRVIRYRGQHEICGRCPSKPGCSPSPGPRELTREVDPWPHSEAGRFHRGIALCIAVVALFLPLCLLFGARIGADVATLGATVIVAALAVLRLARHLWQTPTGFPEHLRIDSSATAPDDAESAADSLICLPHRPPRK